MNEKPSVLVVSDSNTRPKSIIKLLTKCRILQDDPADASRVCHPWIIDTKYYTAEVEVVGIDEHHVRTPQFNENVEALLIHMDSNKSTGLEDLAKYTTDDCHPEVKLLLCNYCTDDTKVTKANATEWCLLRGFELVELYPAAPVDEESIIEEKVGIERVIEALQAHVWPNMVKKDLDDPKTKEQSETFKKWCNQMVSQIEDLQTPTDDFSDLFAQLSMVKDSLQSLPVSQRKQCAELMTTAFWEAIGGDEEELADI